MSALWLIPALWLAYGILGPITLTGKRNQHNAFAVWLREETRGQHQPSIRVQEVGEWRFAKLVGVACGCVAAALVPPFVIDFLVVLFATVIPDSFTRFVKQVDWAGHGAEVMSAEDAGIEGYREAEAARVARDYGVTTAEALQWFEDMRWLSRIIYWLARW